ncbi:ubiquitin carboxyl-terminal hydrolase 8-like isoform X3 [Corticium candelabrum]|uniref:ubiquitin carboxyl-terminal hydrolase 8-like isoform X3 n=1 Tax=Corticium candelabrum TaxID=121492 RepID=UPI002E27269A|nr:ubiquitin carboxyl-terminal hydrolase 8-like isoform X3 [Corticium candelabrum]
MAVTRLYLGKSIADLNSLAEVKVDKTTSPKIYCNTAVKVFEGAATKCRKGDEEKAFVLYMRYCSIVTQIKKSLDYRKYRAECDRILSGTSLGIAIEEAERLLSSLVKRYEALTGVRTEGDGAKDDEKSNDVKLPSPPIGRREVPDGSASTTSSDVYELLKVDPLSILEPKKTSHSVIDTSGNRPVSDSVTSGKGNSASGSIQPTELFNLLKTDASVLILDIRSAESFSSSRMIEGDLVNIPEDVLVAGVSPGLILIHLKPQFRDTWSNRKLADHVILMDYDTTEQASVKNPALPILNLKDAIYKFDSQVTLRSEPRILEGGFCNWILHYPTMVTNSSWTWERRKEEPVDSWLNEDLDYPELPGEGKGKKEEEKTKMDNVEPSTIPQRPPSHTKPEAGKPLNNKTASPAQNPSNPGSKIPIINNTQHHTPQTTFNRGDLGTTAKHPEIESRDSRVPESSTTPSSHTNDQQSTFKPSTPSPNPTTTLSSNAPIPSHPPPSYHTSSSYPLIIPPAATSLPPTDALNNRPHTQPHNTQQKHPNATSLGHHTLRHEADDSLKQEQSERAAHRVSNIPIALSQSNVVPHRVVMPQPVVSLPSSVNANIPTPQLTSQSTVQPPSQPIVSTFVQPSVQATSQLNVQPRLHPTVEPRLQPVIQPSLQPPVQPSLQPTVQPSLQPTVQPSLQPAAQPSLQPLVQPSLQPTVQPSLQPAAQPSLQPVVQPSLQPTVQPSLQPPVQPSLQPAVQPSLQPTIQPSLPPNVQPSPQTTVGPSIGHMHDTAVTIERVLPPVSGQAACQSRVAEEAGGRERSVPGCERVESRERLSSNRSLLPHQEQPALQQPTATSNIHQPPSTTLVSTKPSRQPENPTLSTSTSTSSHIPASGSVADPQQAILPTGQPSHLQTTPQPPPVHSQPTVTLNGPVVPSDTSCTSQGEPPNARLDKLHGRPHAMSQPHGPHGNSRAVYPSSSCGGFAAAAGAPHGSPSNVRLRSQSVNTVALPESRSHGSSPRGSRHSQGFVKPEEQRSVSQRQMPLQPWPPGQHPHVVQRQMQNRVPQPHWLPSGWEKCLDGRTGRYYYKDHTTKTTHWEFPQQLLQQITLSQAKVQAQTVDKERERRRSVEGAGQKIDKPTIDRERKPQLEVVKPNIDRRSKPRAYRPPNKKRDIAPVFGSVGPTLTGLRNLGNTCFMNSVVQCLSATTPLSSYFISGSYVRDVNVENPLGMKGEVAEEFGFVVKSLWCGQYRSISPYDFKFTISRFAPQFSGSQQQDSQELMAFLLDGLHEDLNRVIMKTYVEEKDTTSLPDVEAAQISWTNHLKRNNSVIVDMFQGQFRNTMICLSCRKQSVTFQAFMYLSLPLPSSSRCSLKDCLEFFRRREKVSGEDKWHCPNCKQLREATKQLEIWKLPKVLLIHLKR